MSILRQLLITGSLLFTPLLCASCYAPSSGTPEDSGSIFDTVLESKETRYKREQEARDAQEKIEEERRWREALERESQQRREALERRRRTSQPIPPQVVLFSTSDCAECREVAQLLSNLGVPYTQKLVDRDEQARKALESVWNSNPDKARSLPVTRIGRTHIFGFNERQMVSALKAVITPEAARRQGTAGRDTGSRESNNVKAEAEQFETLDVGARRKTQFPTDVNGAVTPPAPELPE